MLTDRPICRTETAYLKVTPQQDAINAAALLADA
jgi:hypothetical protein